MDVTEIEAKTKWCPMVRHSEDGSSNCIGSECMMWVWEHKPCGHCGLARG